MIGQFEEERVWRGRLWTRFSSQAGSRRRAE